MKLMVMSHATRIRIRSIGWQSVKKHKSSDKH